MKLAIFDIDGTLIDSNAIDWVCFLEAFDRAFGLSAAQTDWSAYSHHTDRGLTHEFLRRAWQREPDEEAIALHRTAFLSLLQARMQSLQEIRGARAFVESLPQRGWSVALATGAWSASARMKLEISGFPSDLPLSCCDDLNSREEIVQRAMASGANTRVVIFGDGAWDVTVARNLALPFIGIGSGPAAEVLRAAGAKEIVADFSDADEVIRAMERAGVPLR